MVGLVRLAGETEAMVNESPTHDYDAIPLFCSFLNVCGVLFGIGGIVGAAVELGGGWLLAAVILGGGVVSALAAFAASQLLGCVRDMAIHAGKSYELLKKRLPAVPPRN